MPRLYHVFSLVIIIYFVGLLHFVSLLTHLDNKIQGSTDAIIVLTGGTNRITTGLELLIAGKGKKLFITGVAKGTNLKDIEYFNKELPNKYLQNLEDRISLGYLARNTKENALEAKEWIADNNVKSIILVTSNYHMPRSMLEFKLALPEINIKQNSVLMNNLVNKDHYKLYYKIFTEYNKYLIVKIRSEIKLNIFKDKLVTI